MASKHWGAGGVRTVLGCLFCVLAQPAMGLNFNFTYNAAQSTPPATISDSFGPISDPNGTVLMNMVQTAADMWSDVILDDWTINVELRWQAPANAGNSAQMFQFQAHPGNTEGDPAEQSSRVVWAQIIFNPNRNWWVDSTPLNHSEFDMAQTLYRDLPMAQRTGWFAGPPPNLLEVGYSGAVNASAPAAMQVPGSASATLRSRDLLSYALHELGHTVGVGGTTAAANEYSTDGDYDINPALAGNTAFSVESTSTSDGHITSSPTSPTAPALMHSNNLCCARRLPSALDVMAAEATANWTGIRLLRTDFLTGASWNTAGNWEGNRTPSTAVDAFVRTGDTVTLSGFGAAGNLLVDEGSTVSTQTNTLFVQNRTDVGGTPGDNSQITINTDGELDSDLLNINDDGTVVLVGVSSLLQAERVNIAAGGELRGQGTLDLNDNLFGLLTSEGLIRATSGGELVITSQNGLGLDLAGGEIEAIDGNIRFETGMADAMGADLTVGAGRQVAFNSGGSVGAGGLLLLNGGVVSPARSTGSTLFVENNGVVRADGLGIITNPLVLLPSSIVETEPGTPNSEIRFNGTTSFQGGRVVGDGIARQNGAATIQQDTEIDIDTYDLDGQAGNTVITVNSGRTLDINSPHIETGGVNDFDGTLQINSGTVDIASAWRLDGTLNLAQTSATTPVLTGAGGVTVSNNGEINITGSGDIETALSVDIGTVFVDGDAVFSGPTILGNNATVEIDSDGDTLRLLGATTLINPSIVGNGRIIFDGSINVAFFDTFIGVAETDLDGLQGNTEITINQGLIFSIASTTLEPTANDGFDGVITNHGTFSVLAGWRLDGELNNDQIGATMPTVAGLGTFRIHTTGAYSTDGDSLITAPLAVAGAMDLDGGITQVNNTASFESTASISFANDAVLELNGSTAIAGGTYTGAGLIQFNAATTVSATTTISVGRVDLDGAAENTQITVNNAALVLNVDRVDEFNNLVGGTLNVSGNSGRLEVNLSNPPTPWLLSATGILNLTTASLFPVTMLDGSDAIVQGRINASGRTRLGANIALAGRLNTVINSTDVYFAGGGQNLFYSSSITDGLGNMTLDNGTRLHLQHGTNVGIDVENSGRLEIGFAPNEVETDFTEAGSATIRANYAQTSAGLFGVEVGGLTSGTQHDFLNVLETARLAGTLEVELIDSFLPEVGDEVLVLAANLVVNTFDTLVAFDAQQMYGVYATALYTATTVTVRFDDIFLLGDYNRNGVVDAADYTVWRDTLGQIGPGLAADGNANGQIDAGDYTVWTARFGNIAGGGASANVMANVPEPATAVLLIVGILATCSRRRAAAAIGVQ
ncbi:MAG: hypothetical protein WD851_07860 [Pirellulales bacterium]